MLTAEPARSIPAVLERLGSVFQEFSTAFNDGEYVLWLGSGISRDRVPNVTDMLERVVEHLRSNIDAGNAACEFRVALEEVLHMVGLENHERDSIDFTAEVASWPLRGRILTSLVTNYSRVLDVVVGDDKPDDYLVWTGLDVPNVYGAPDLEPDVEHYCIALLMLEGLVTSAVTANWDGLLEKALAELTPAYEASVRVAVRADDFRIVGPRLEVIKFHGCAVLARTNEDDYRGLLVARESQISGWTEQTNNRSMRKHLEVLYTDRLTLMIGLSAQDANLHTVFATAVGDLSRPWPALPPAVVLSEERLESYHRNLLKLTYGTGHQGNAVAIADSALLGAYGKPTLLALVLSALTDKLRFLVGRELEHAWRPEDIEYLLDGLLALRDSGASVAQPDDWETCSHEAVIGFQREFIARFIDTAHLILTVFRTGQPPAAGTRSYEPMSERTITQAVLNADFPSRQFGHLGIALALIGRGVLSSDWGVTPGDAGHPGGGVLVLKTDQQYARTFMVKDAATLAQLEFQGLFDETDDDVLLVVADVEPPTLTRSPRSRYGRDGRAGVGRFNVASNIAEAKSAKELLEAFKLAGGL
jgi:hypothetical protein